MNFISGVIFVGIAFVLAVRTFFVMAIFNIELPTSVNALVYPALAQREMGKRRCPLV